MPHLSGVDIRISVLYRLIDASPLHERLSLARMAAGAILSPRRRFKLPVLRLEPLDGLYRQIVGAFECRRANSYATRATSTFVISSSMTVGVR
jgi:hypothetical protein